MIAGRPRSIASVRFWSVDNDIGFPPKRETTGCVRQIAETPWSFDDSTSVIVRKLSRSLGVADKLELCQPRPESVDGCSTGNLPLSDIKPSSSGGSRKLILVYSCRIKGHASEP
jgi:hypothetical protein